MASETEVLSGSGPDTLEARDSVDRKVAVKFALQSLFPALNDDTAWLVPDLKTRGGNVRTSQVARCLEIETLQLYSHTNL